MDTLENVILQNLNFLKGTFFLGHPVLLQKLYDLLSREAAYNTIFIYQSIWPNLIRVLHICVHIPTHPKLWDKTI